MIKGSYRNWMIMHEKRTKYILIFVSFCLFMSLNLLTWDTPCDILDHRVSDRYIFDTPSEISTFNRDYASKTGLNVFKNVCIENSKGGDGSQKNQQADQQIKAVPIINIQQRMHVTAQ